VQIERRHFIQIPLVGAVYFLTAHVGLQIDAVSGFAALIWPPTGIAISATLLFGYPIGIAILVGAFMVNYFTGASFLGSMIIGVGNTLEALAAVYFLRRYARISLRLNRLKDAWTFLLACLFAPMISATIGVIVVTIDQGRTLEGIWPTWQAWWVGDVIGALVIAPFLLSLFTHRWKVPSLGRTFEFTVLLIILFLVGLSLFNGVSQYTYVPTNFPYLLFPLVVWGALRFGQVGNTSVAVIISYLAVTGTIQGMGPFAGANLRESLLLLHGFMAVISSTCILLAAAIAERNEAILARDEFLSIASHELKTPITSLSLQTQSMLRGLKINPDLVPAREKLSQFFSSSYQQIHRLALLVDDLMDISRLHSGRLTLRFETVNVSDILLDTANRVAAQAQAAGCKLESSIQSNVIADCDGLRIEQVINNLISNAIKYAPGTPLKISLTGNNKSLCITVEDGGAGIPKESQNKIFERFERVNPPKKNISGLGLGLFIVRQIVLAHAGDVHLEKSSYGGAKFVVEMPLKKTVTV
jgi:signal transduction histidine kinase